MVVQLSRLFTRPILIILVLVLAGGGRLAGQTASSEDESAVFSESVRVNVVNVDVRVTDKKGNPILALTPEDFQVFEDGKPVRLTNFYVIENGRRRQGVGTKGAVAEETPRSPSPAPAPQRVSDVGDDVVSGAVSEADQLRLVVYFDNYNVRPLERNRILKRLSHFVRRIVGPDDLVMVASFDRSVKIRQHFTNDTDLVATELAKLEDDSGHRVLRDRERQAVIQTIDEANSSDLALSAALNYAETLYNEMGYNIDGLKEILSFVAGLPGRKVLVHVSGGMPMVAAEDLFYAIEQKFEDSRALGYAARYDLSRRFQEVEDRANANHVTFYTLDAVGLRVNTTGAAEHRGLNTAGLAFRLDSDYESNLQSPLRYLAEETGGRAIVNQNDILPGLEQMASDLRSLYSLGFVPAHDGDGQYHDIEVKVNRKGVEVLHRSGYRDKSPEMQMIDGTMAALLHSYQKNPLHAELAFGDARAQEDGTFLVPIEVRVPLADVALLPTGESHEAHLRFFVAVMNEKGSVSPVQQVPAGLRLRNEYVEAARAESFLHHQELLMRRGLHKVALGIRDELSGEEAFLTQSRVID